MRSISSKDRRATVLRTIAGMQLGCGIVAVIFMPKETAGAPMSDDSTADDDEQRQQLAARLPPGFVRPSTLHRL